MEAKRTARLRLRRHELKFEVVDDAVYGPELLDEGHDLHPAALMEAMSTARLPHLGQRFAVLYEASESGQAIGSTS